MKHFKWSLALLFIASLNGCSPGPSIRPEAVVYPEEVDTIVIGRPVRITSIKGEIRAKDGYGTLSTISEGYLLKKGQMLLVPKGASFKIGGNQFGPEYHGDRWVKLQ